ncbi:MAG TPA: hypothetical protein PLW70_00545 [Bacteroidales bacterium]|nr:hypothetical protein [Bacteroidales bacterium]HQB19061.1 hypothetical protein [Bacteroidales bacterium]
MTKGRTLQVKKSKITIISQQNTDYISLWKRINNPDFNYPEFGVIG